MTPPSQSGRGSRRWKCSQPRPGRVHTPEEPLCSLVGGGPRNLPQIQATLGGKASLLWLHRCHLPLEAAHKALGPAQLFPPEVSSSGNRAQMPIQADASTHIWPPLMNSPLQSPSYLPKGRGGDNTVTNVMTIEADLAAGCEVWLLLLHRLLPQIFNHRGGFPSPAWGSASRAVWKSTFNPRTFP